MDKDLEKLKRSIQGLEVSRVKRLLRSVSGERVDRVDDIEVSRSYPPEKVKIGCYVFHS